MVIWNPDTKCLGFFGLKCPVLKSHDQPILKTRQKSVRKVKCLRFQVFDNLMVTCIECWQYFICFCADKKSVMKTRIQAELSRQVSSQWNPPCVHPSGLRPNQDGSFSRQGTCASTRRLAQTRIDLREV